MPKKLSDETIFMRRGGRYVPVGKLYDRDTIGYGTYFVNNSKYGNRSLHWIGAAPDPDFLRLETAVEESRDELRCVIREIVAEFQHDPNYFKYDYEVVDKVIQAIRKTFLDKKKKMLQAIKQ